MNFLFLIILSRIVLCIEIHNQVNGNINADVHGDNFNDENNARKNIEIAESIDVNDSKGPTNLLEDNPEESLLLPSHTNIEFELASERKAWNDNQELPYEYKKWDIEYILKLEENQHFLNCFANILIPDTSLIFIKLQNMENQDFASKVNLAPIHECIDKLEIPKSVKKHLMKCDDPRTSVSPQIEISLPDDVNNWIKICTTIKELVGTLLISTDINTMAQKTTEENKAALINQDLANKLIPEIKLEDVQELKDESMNSDNLEFILNLKDNKNFLDCFVNILIPDTSRILINLKHLENKDFASEVNMDPIHECIDKLEISESMKELLMKCGDPDAFVSPQKEIKIPDSVVKNLIRICTIIKNLVGTLLATNNSSTTAHSITTVQESMEESQGALTTQDLEDIHIETTTLPNELNVENGLSSDIKVQNHVQEPMHEFKNSDKDEFILGMRDNYKFLGCFANILNLKDTALDSEFNLVTIEECLDKLEISEYVMDLLMKCDVPEEFVSPQIEISIPDVVNNLIKNCMISNDAREVSEVFQDAVTNQKALLNIKDASNTQKILENEDTASESKKEILNDEQNSFKDQKRLLLLEYLATATTEVQSKNPVQDNIVEQSSTVEKAASKESEVQLQNGSDFEIMKREKLIKFVEDLAENILQDKKDKFERTRLDMDILFMKEVIAAEALEYKDENDANLEFLDEEVQNHNINSQTNSESLKSEMTSKYLSEFEMSTSRLPMDLEIPELEVNVEELVEHFEITKPSGDGLFINVIEVSSWDKAVSRLRLPQNFKGLPEDGQVLMEQRSNVDDLGESAIFTMADGQVSLACIVGDLCLSCDRYIKSPTGYPFCCHLCGTIPSIVVQDDANYKCNCHYPIN